MQWTEALRGDLLACHAASEPDRRGYMARMHSLWCEMHPEHNHLSQQNLRDYANHLRKKETPHQPPVQRNSPPARPPSPTQAASPPAEARTALVPVSLPEREEAGQVVSELRSRLLSAIIYDEGHTRQRDIHRKISLRGNHLPQLNGLIDEILTETSDLWTVNCVVYAAAKIMAHSQKNAPWEDKAAKRLKQLEAKITQARQQASRIQCVTEYIVSGRTFTPKVRRIARSLRYNHHTLNKSVLLTIKQHAVDRVRALTTARKKLLKRSRAVRENFTFLLHPSRLFRPPPPVVKSPPPVQEVERFWKEIYETSKPFNGDTPAIVLFKTHRQIQTDSQEHLEF
jgi:hypothetical protein